MNVDTMLITTAVMMMMMVVMVVVIMIMTALVIMVMVVVVVMVVVMIMTAFVNMLVDMLVNMAMVVIVIMMTTRELVGLYNLLLEARNAKENRAQFRKISRETTDFFDSPRRHVSSCCRRKQAYCPSVEVKQASGQYFELDDEAERGESIPYS